MQLYEELVICDFSFFYKLAPTEKNSTEVKIWDIVDKHIDLEEMQWARLI